MEARYKKMGGQLGKTFEYGSHMPHVVVGVLRRRRTNKYEDRAERLEGGSNVKPIEEYKPYPAEFLPASY